MVINWTRATSVDGKIQAQKYNLTNTYVTAVTLRSRLHALHMQSTWLTYFVPDIRITHHSKHSMQRALPTSQTF